MDGVIEQVPLQHGVMPGTDRRGMADDGDQIALAVVRL